MSKIIRGIAVVFLIFLAASCEPSSEEIASATSMAAQEGTSAALNSTGTVLTQAAQQTAAAEDATATAQAVALAATKAYQATQQAIISRKYWIAFTAFDVDLDPTGMWRLYAVRPDGLGLKQLSRNDFQEGNLDFTPDGKTIIFDGNRFNEKGDIYRMNIDGGEVRNLTSNQSFSKYGPIVSPDGGKFVFISEQGKRDIFLMDTDGKGLTNISANAAKLDDAPIWSPDGRSIFYVSELVQMGMVNWKVKVLASDVFFHLYSLETKTNKTFPGVDTGDFSWSPDGSKIAFTCSETDPDNAEEYLTRLCTLDLVSEEYKALVQQKNSPDKFYFIPEWSPDGSRVAYYSDEEGNRGLFVVNADGSQIQNLLDGSTILDEKEIENLSWSPDGEQILFQTSENEIYVMRSDGSNLNLVVGPVQNMQSVKWVPEIVSQFWNESIKELEAAQAAQEPTPTLRSASAAKSTPLPPTLTPTPPAPLRISPILKMRF